MKTRVLAVFVPIVALILSWAVIAQGHGTEPLPSGDPPTILPPAPTATATWQTPQENPKSRRQTILLWPKGLEQFTHEYSSWELWLGEGHTSPYSPRDELLVSVRAIAAMVPDLAIGTDEYQSDIIIVSGNPATLGALLDRLREHPLLARVTEDSRTLRDESRTIWAKQRFDLDFDTPQRSPAHTVNVRNNWVTNIVWGYSTPNTTVYVTLTRNSLHFLTATATVSLEGLYHAYLAWEIRDGDVIEVNDGIEIKRVSVIPLQASGEPSVASVTGVALPAPDAAGKPSVTAPHSLDVTIGKASQTVTFNSEGAFATDFSGQPFRPGTRGFLCYTDADKNRIFKPFSISIVNVRRDTSYGTPYGDTHSAGISSIVWGSATPSSTLVITLTRSGSFVVTRTVAADQVGSFAVSMDRLIEDGDIVQVSDSASVRTVQVPTMTFHADPATRIITGTAPAGITITVSGAPHSLEASIAGDSHQVTTTVTGEFSADFTSRPYLAGLLGTLRYTTPSGDRVYKPLFVADPLTRGKLADWRADIILGQPDFSQITPNEVVSNKIFNPFGLYVDRSVQPNRVYVYDSGNSRVLGLSHLGTCLAGPNAGQACTTNSDCPTSSCQIQEYRAADIVFGQPSFNSSACNGDSGYQMYPDVPMASAGTLCGLREEQVSITEGGSAATMAADAQGNLYVPDFFNNRVLRYNSPFTTDSVADYVWGQADFSGITCNRGASFSGRPGPRSLCLAPHPGVGDVKAGVATDSASNLWAADTNNNRVLRFPYSSTLGIPAQEADLVLGQPDFFTNVWGAGLHQMNKPASVRVNNSGVVYVADSSNNRVLVFEPPLWSGMQADRVLGSGLREPIGLEIDPNGGIWVNDMGNSRIVHFMYEVQDKTITQTDVFGGLGVDQDGNLMSTLSGSFEEAAHFSAPTYTLDAKFLRSNPEGDFNQTGSRGSSASAAALEVVAGQLIVVDRTRMLFWNNPWGLTNYQPADGVVGEPNFQTRHTWGPSFSEMSADNHGRLWVLSSAVWPANIYGYHLPLTTGATPVFTITSPLPLQGGGVFTWTEFLASGGIDVQPDCDCLWVSDPSNNRVFRIRDVSSQPVVDVVLGQLSVSGISCNQGRDAAHDENPWGGHPLFPSRDSLCHPGEIAFDTAGNLFVADNSPEIAGNWRLLEFDANTIPSAPFSAVFGISATRVFGRGGSFTEPNCQSSWEDPMCGPSEPAFDSQSHMVVGFNAYLLIVQKLMSHFLAFPGQV